MTRIIKYQIIFYTINERYFIYVFVYLSELVYLFICVIIELCVIKITRKVHYTFSS